MTSKLPGDESLEFWQDLDRLWDCFELNQDRQTFLKSLIQRHREDIGASECPEVSDEFWRVGYNLLDANAKGRLDREGLLQALLVMHRVESGLGLPGAIQIVDVKLIDSHNAERFHRFREEKR